MHANIGVLGMARGLWSCEGAGSHLCQLSNDAVAASLRHALVGHLDSSGLAALAVPGLKAEADASLANHLPDGKVWQAGAQACLQLCSRAALQGERFWAGPVTARPPACHHALACCCGTIPRNACPGKPQHPFRQHIEHRTLGVRAQASGNSHLAGSAHNPVISQHPQCSRKANANCYSVQIVNQHL